MATTTNSTGWSRPYPPMVREGIVDEHDKPYFYHGHKDAAKIVEEYKFCLPLTFAGPAEKEGKEKAKDFKLECQKMAMAGFGKVPLNDTLQHILSKLKDHPIRYICVANETIPDEDLPRINIQIVFSEKRSVYGRFMDQFLNTKCEYRVTKYGDAWNEFIKKGLNFIEYGLFKGSLDNGVTRYWSSSEKKRKQCAITEDVACEVFEMSKSDPRDALLHLVKQAPKESLSSIKRFDSNLEYFRYKIQVQQQQEQALAKDLCWPDSFPDCTANLKEAMNDWLIHHFRQPGRPKCLILIGPTETGKTSFARSLPGFANHCRGVWSADSWEDTADYMIIDDVPWNEFHTRGFPNPEELITCQQFLNIKDKSNKIRRINTAMSAIVIMNPHIAIPFLKLINQYSDTTEAQYWKKRAFVYVMKEHEYFHKPMGLKFSTEENMTTIDDLPIFAEARRNWHAKQNQSNRSSNSTSFLVDNVTTPQQDDDNQEHSEIRSTISEEYPYDH